MMKTCCCVFLHSAFVWHTLNILKMYYLRPATTCAFVAKSGGKRKQVVLVKWNKIGSSTRLYFGWRTRFINDDPV